MADADTATLSDEWITEALASEMSKEEKAKRYKEISERRLKLKKIEKQLKQELAGKIDSSGRLQGGLFGPGEHEVEDGLTIVVDKVEQTRFDQKKAKAFIEKVADLEDYQYVSRFPSVRFEDLRL